MIDAVVNHLWQSTLFLAVAALLSLALRRNGAHVRFWLWFAASAKFLIPISLLGALTAYMGMPHAPVFDSPAVSSVVQEITEPFAFGPAERGADNTAGEVGHASDIGAHAPLGKDGHAAEYANPNLQSGEPSPAGTADHWTTRPAITSLFLTVWACGFAVVLALWLVRWMRIRQAVRSATPMAVEAPIPVMSASSHLEPGVVGIVRPILLLPEGIAKQLTAAELQAILAHEMCHVRRRDNFTAAIHMLVEAVFWFYPLVWWLGARLVEERERACDEAVVVCGNDPQVYAEGILKVCRFYAASPVPFVSGVTGANLKKRIESIMTNRILLNLNLARKLLLASVAGVVALGIYEGTSNPAQAAPATPSFRKALVLRDIPSWNRATDFEDVLKTIGLAFDVKPSSEMATVNLAAYDVVVVPGAQWGTAYYRNFASAAAAFERYVSAGGTLVVEMNGAEREGITLPGGVSLVAHGALDNLVTVPEHPILAPLAGKPRITANLASHGYLMDVPAGALVLVAEMEPGKVSADMSRPTFVEYDYGKGRILAAAQCFHDQDGSGRGPLMATLLQYAAAGNWVSSAVVPGTSIAKSLARKTVVDLAAYDRLVGYYRFGSVARIVRVWREGDRLLTKLNAQPPVEIFPKDEREFFAKTLDVQYRFEAGTGGEATALTFRQGGRELRGRRMDETLARQTLDALDKRIQDNVPAPASEAALRRHLSAILAGKPDYDQLSPALAEAVRIQLPGMRTHLQSLGALQSVQFTKVMPDGHDAYDARFERGSARFQLSVAPDGVIDSVRVNFGP